MYSSRHKERGQRRTIMWLTRGLSLITPSPYLQAPSCLADRPLRVE